MSHKATFLSTTRASLTKLIGEGSIYVELTKDADLTSVPRSANFVWFSRQAGCRIFIPDAIVELRGTKMCLKTGLELYSVSKECVTSIRQNTGSYLWPA